MRLLPEIEITEEEALPRPKLICPVCGFEHEIRSLNDGGEDDRYYFIPLKGCVLEDAEFNTRKGAIKAMKNLIKAFKEK